MRKKRHVHTACAGCLVMQLTIWWKLHSET